MGCNSYLAFSCPSVKFFHIFLLSCVLYVLLFRIMSVGPRPFPQGRRNEDGSDPRATMTYEDYVYFMLSEEDRGNEHSLRYWFACVDLDGDGRIGHMEMRLFYDNQVSTLHEGST